MRFGTKSKVTLRDMGICPEDFWQSIAEEFGEIAIAFDLLIEEFRERDLESLRAESFNEFYESKKYQDNEIFHNKLYDLFNYLRLFKDGGRFGLYKNRQAEWNGPRVVLERSDVSILDTDPLDESTPIYRGMSVAELESNRFGQSWTTNIIVATHFAFDTYTDKPRGLVAVTALKYSDLIYHCRSDPEHEVIVVNESITAALRVDA